MTQDEWPSRFTVAPPKIMRYLLDPEHPDGGSKAKFLKQFGFTADNPHDLHGALISHAERSNFAGTERGHKSLKFYFQGFLLSLIREQPHVRTVWQIDDDDPTKTARFITLVPLPRMKSAPAR